MDVDSNTNTNEEASPSPSPPPSPNRRACTRSSSKHIESAFRAAQDLAARVSSTTNNKTSTANHESCTTTGVSVKSTTTNDVISIKAGPGCLLPPSFFGVLDNETEEERQRRRAVFAAKRQRHVLADNLHAHYEAILAAVSDEEQEPQQLQQDINNVDNAAFFRQNAARPPQYIMTVAMDLFMEMETTDDEEEGKSE